MAITYETKPAFTIPTVNIADYLRDPQSSQADHIVEQIRNACATSGFFQIVGHGVPESLQQRVFSAAKTFFALPEDEKVNLKGKPGRGYEVIGGQILEVGKKPDLKEGYMIGREVPGSKPPYKPFQDPNVWPDPAQLPESQFKEPLLQYQKALTELSIIMMHILARGLKGFDTSVFEDYCKDPIANVRLLHYPPHPKTDDASLVGAGAHTDFGAITLLLQDGHSGLQVLNNDTKEWIDVTPTEGAYVVNIGDMLEVWVSGAYRSNLHRVVNTSGVDRYSIPFFWDGNPDCVIKPLDGKEGKQFTVTEHMLSRYQATYG